MDGLPKPRRYYAIVATSFGTSLAVIDGTIVSVALPTIARDLNVTPSSAVLLVTVYQLVLVMSLLPFSALGSRIGLLRLYQYGQVLFLAATVLCFFARSLPFLLVVRTLQALGTGAALSVSTGLMREIYRLHGGVNQRRAGAGHRRADSRHCKLAVAVCRRSAARRPVADHRPRHTAGVGAAR
jgi:DHA2 family multidrug resistance protein-like MFS transporter